MTLTAANPVLRAFMVASAVLALKMVAMAFATAYYRITKSVFANPEDAPPKVAVKSDPDVERVRRAHQNDLENIPLFLALGLMFVLTEPSMLAARLCFYGFAAARVVHSVAYLRALQPYRALAFLYGQAVNIYMAFSVLAAFWY